MGTKVKRGTLVKTSVTIAVVFLLTFILFLTLGQQNNHAWANIIGGSCSSHADCTSPASCLGGRCDFGNPCSTTADCTSAHGANWTCQDIGVLGPTCVYSGSRTSTSTSTSTTTQKTYTAPKPVEKKSASADITFPEQYLQEGNATSDLSGLLEKNASAYANFTLDDVANGKVVFLDAMNLNDADLATQLKDVDKYVVIKKGTVSVDVAEATKLNGKAQVTMRGLNLVAEKFAILRDGEDAGENITDVTYDSETKVLIFNVAGFSEYKVVPDFSVDAMTSNIEVSKYTVKGLVGDLDAVVTVFVNDVEVATAVPVAEDGTFSVEVALVEGVNTVRTESKSFESEVQEDSQEVTYTKPVLERVQDYVMNNLVLVSVVGASVIAVAVILLVVVVKMVKKKKDGGIKNKVSEKTKKESA